jgi:hypothetical protein
VGASFSEKFVADSFMQPLKNALTFHWQIMKAADGSELPNREGWPQPGDPSREKLREARTGPVDHAFAHAHARSSYGTTARTQDY